MSIVQQKERVLFLNFTLRCFLGRIYNSEDLITMGISEVRCEGFNQ